MSAQDALYVATSRVDGFAGWGAATIQWLRRGREAPPAPYAALIADYPLLPLDVRGQAERAVLALFTRDEADALRRYFGEAFPALAARLQSGALSAPLHADELATLVEAAPDPEAGRCLVRLPARAPPPPFPVVGVAAPWPWPDLEPADVARLIDVRERLGLAPVPPLSGPSDGPR